MTPELTPITDSSSIAGAAYKDGILWVRFHNGATWQYGTGKEPVPEIKYEKLLAAKSKGAYFTAAIRGLYAGECISGSGSLGVESKEGEVIVATPLYLALLRTKKLLAKGYNFPHGLWVACGSEETTQPNSRYHRCMLLIAEAGGMDKIGKEYLDSAIALAKEKRL